MSPEIYVLCSDEAKRSRHRQPTYPREQRLEWKWKGYEPANLKKGDFESLDLGQGYLLGDYGNGRTDPDGSGRMEWMEWKKVWIWCRRKWSWEVFGGTSTNVLVYE